eukprot:TRINITY_DN29937_c0_g1_i1.p1 TRINITY_DN29937_c0_g1~~TRINITY_DN29937_c0_g1_i1.p1  ORF type:complete len:184 (-),score=37.29 TRINITY_DN29937_c0_g1_i1:470-988(-)
MNVRMPVDEWTELERRTEVYQIKPSMQTGNDQDPHAACEMLSEYEKKVQRLVLENAVGDLFQGEEVQIAEQALSKTDWDPGQSFAAAKDFALAVQQTRQAVRQKDPMAPFFAVDVVLPALAATDMKPQAAAGLLLGVPVPKGMPKPVPLRAGETLLESGAGGPSDEDNCTIS